MPSADTGSMPDPRIDGPKRSPWAAQITGTEDVQGPGDLKTAEPLKQPDAPRSAPVPKRRGWGRPLLLGATTAALLAAGAYVGVTGARFSKGAPVTEISGEQFSISATPNLFLQTDLDLGRVEGVFFETEHEGQPMIGIDLINRNAPHILQAGDNAEILQFDRLLITNPDAVAAFAKPGTLGSFDLQNLRLIEGLGPDSDGVRTAVAEFPWSAQTGTFLPGLTRDVQGTLQRVPSDGPDSPEVWKLMNASQMYLDDNVFEGGDIVLGFASDPALAGLRDGTEVTLGGRFSIGDGPHLEGINSIRIGVPDRGDFGSQPSFQDGGFVNSAGAEFPHFPVRSRGDTQQFLIVDTSTGTAHMTDVFQGGDEPVLKPRGSYGMEVFLHGGPEVAMNGDNRPVRNDTTYGELLGRADGISYFGTSWDAGNILGIDRNDQLALVIYRE